MSRNIRKPAFAYAKIKTQISWISCVVAWQLIIAFVSASSVQKLKSLVIFLFLKDTNGNLEDRFSRDVAQVKNHPRSHKEEEGANLKLCVLVHNKIVYMEIMTAVLQKHFGVTNCMSCDIWKLVFGVSDRVWHKPGCAVTKDGERLEILYFGSRGILLFV